MGRVGSGKERLRALGACAGLTFVVTAGTGRAHAGQPPAGAGPAVPRIRIADSRARDAVRRALDNARAQLAEESCRRVLSDFADPSGRPLQATVEDLVEEPTEYLGQLFFYDGSGLPQCRPAVAAATIRGSRVVLICADRFVKLRWPDGEVTLIHEMLHSLGLGENPPAPREISRGVETRCYLRRPQRTPAR